MRSAHLQDGGLVAVGGQQAQNGGPEVAVLVRAVLLQQVLPDHAQGDVPAHASSAQAAAARSAPWEAPAAGTQLGSNQQRCATLCSSIRALPAPTAAVFLQHAERAGRAPDHAAHGLLNQAGHQVGCQRWAAPACEPRTCSALAALRQGRSSPAAQPALLTFQLGPCSVKPSTLTRCRQPCAGTQLY